MNLILAQAVSDSTTIWTSVQSSLDTTVGRIWPIATALAAVGVAVMALFQSLKDVVRAHDRFDRWSLRSWMRRRSKHVSEGAEFEGAYRDLIELVGGDERAFYSLDVAQLVGQISAAARLVLDFPGRHPALLRVLVLGGERRVSHGRRASDGKTPDGVTAQSISALEQDLDVLLKGSGQRIEPVPANRSIADSALIDARTRIEHQIQRTLDGLLCTLTYRWSYWNQTVALVLNILVVIALFWNGLRTTFGLPWLPSLLTSILMGTVAGFVAPVAKDVVTALQQLKSRVR